MYLVVWLLPQPVRTAQTATTGTEAVSIVASGPSSVKLAPAAMTSLALCITYSYDTSEYANTTSSTFRSAMRSASSSSGWISMPFGYRGPASCAG